MYDERKNRFSLRDIIIQILLLVLFVFILVWLFPTKNFLKDKNVIDNNELYTNYMTSMSDAAKDYFTTSKVPTKVGESVKLTLSEMLDKKLVLSIGGNVSCDLEKSYIEVTKMDEDYQLRVELSCEDFSDYVVVTLGCKDFCNLTCTTTPTTTKPSTTKPTTTPTQQSTKKYTVTFDSKGGSSVSSQTVESGKKTTKPTNPTKEGYTFVEWTLNGKTYDFNTAVTSNITLIASWKEIVVAKVEYEYSKAITTSYSYSDWSSWSSVQRVWEKNKTFTNTDTTEYEVVSTGLTAFNGNYDCGTTIVDKQPAELITETDYADKVVVDYKYNSTEWKLSANEYVAEYPLTKFYNNTNESLATIKYEFKEIRTVSSCSSCTATTQYVYNVYTRSVSKTAVKECPTGYTENSSGKCYKETETYSCTKYGEGYSLISDAIHKCIKRGEKCTPKYEDFTDYKYRTRVVNSGISTSYDYKWSTSNNDASLIAQGYKLTGKTR